MHNDGLLVGMDFDHNLFGYEIEPLDLTLEIIIRLNLYNKQVMFKKFDRIENLEIQIRNILEN
nr:DUF2750 domain-containing protein [Chryseobacterium sp. IHB B 17019]